ncbi:hypothetical protein [Companilactobacillus mishanensis]|uniref:Surface layer protein A domain-containing protein n=1 Tax=Companilactobacillus mishanensis TaxID=2486008 RepID=A0ABW9P668_9LACO|nr:hypothetical protein [Companilactobacillus mishanensis]MQS44720.1 hypothetical protein [Companilactobacillus mishanensis]MQS89824.1 hypothetical protein [Companilactobacillus mishanensis]
MKINKTFKGVLAAAMMLSIGVAPVVAMSNVNTVQASPESRDFPDGTKFPDPETLIVYSDGGDSVVFLRNYNNGKLTMSNRGLANDSGWYADEYMWVQGEKYYRVSTNEWVASRDILYFD